MSASMAEGIAGVLAEHQPTTSSSSFNQPNGGGNGRYCSCGEKFDVLFTELADDENDTTPRLNAKLAAHQAEQLAANGYGKLEDAWDQGAVAEANRWMKLPENPHRKPGN